MLDYTAQRSRSTASGTTTSSRSRMIYAFSENFVLPFSHDEVVHGKRSMLDKMPGDVWQKFANLRALYGYMFGASRQEAAVHGRRVRAVARVEPRRAAWTGTLLDHAGHAGLQRWVRDLNRALPRAARRSAQHDYDPAGFQWIDCNDHENSVISLLRRAADPDGPRRGASSTSRRCRGTGTASACPRPARYRELLNSDSHDLRRQRRRQRGGARRRAVAGARLRAVGAAHGAAARVPALRAGAP